MIIYLSGPISGNPTYLDDFAVAANWLASAGHSPVNPCDISQDHWGKCRPGYDPGEGGDHTSACFMTKDLLALLDADAIMMWGEQNHADGTGPVTRPLRRLAVNLYLRSAVELANAAKKRCDAEHAAGHGKWDSILLEARSCSAPNSSRSQPSHSSGPMPSTGARWEPPSEHRRGSCRRRRHIPSTRPLGTVRHLRRRDAFRQRPFPHVDPA